GWDTANSIAVDGNGDVVVAGDFSGTVDFGGGLLTSAGTKDIFVAKYSGADGSHQWSKRYGGTGDDHASGVTLDNGGNVGLTGSFKGTVDFGGGALITPGADMFVAKYSAAGS